MDTEQQQQEQTYKTHFLRPKLVDRILMKTQVKGLKVNGI